jgi:SAM-dependent methyltransferase
MTACSYPFLSSDKERQRLIDQNKLLAPLTERLFRRAGLSAGMRVLEIGSGAGDVAFIAARFVGPAGAVLGIDRDPAQVRFAEQRARAEGLANVDFTVADFQQFVLREPVDAVVGRLALMYASDPLAALLSLQKNLKRGGIMALQESTYDYDAPPLIDPPDCLAAQAVRWCHAAFRHAGVKPRLGLRLCSLMREAGLQPSPEIEMLTPLLQGPQGPLFGTIAALVRSQLPAIVASGAATEAEIDIETLEQRMIADAPEGGVVGYFNSGHVGVWARKT